MAISRTFRAALPHPNGDRWAARTPDTATAADPPSPDVLDACRYASLQLGGPRLRSLAVTSTVRGEGRSTIARALAHIQGHDYRRRVVLVELDLEQPGLAARLGARPSPGLAELAQGIAAVDDVVQPLADGTTLVTAGAPGAGIARTMAEILRSGALAAIQERFDAVIADLPPLLGSGIGPAPLATFENVLLVVRSGVTPVERIREATGHLAAEPKVLLNGTQSNLPSWLRRLVGC